jgi:hypothetical protein
LRARSRSFCRNLSNFHRISVSYPWFG